MDVVIVVVEEVVVESVEEVMEEVPTPSLSTSQLLSMWSSGSTPGLLSRTLVHGAWCVVLGT